MIELSNLEKSYGETRALKGVSLSISKGEVVGLLGPNGAGKTTAMKIVVGYLLPTSGSATVAGLDVVSHPLEVQRKIGYLPESAPLYLDMMAQEHLEFMADMRGLDAATRRRRMPQVVEECGIGRVLTRPIGQLSKGYRQRVGLAAAILHDPELLILDEPTNGLDPNQIIEVRQLIKSLSGNHTIILSTHILPEVSMTCQRVVIIAQGKIAAVDTPENLTRQLQGSDRIYLEASGPEPSISSKIKEIDGVLQVESHKLDGSDAFSYSVETELKKDVRGRLARKIVESGFELLEMRTMSMSLEEVFLQLTTKEEGVRNK